MLGDHFAPEKHKMTNKLPHSGGQCQA
jgi:hypothetical protein